MSDFESDESPLVPQEGLAAGTVDDDTILTTPAPVAASTVARDVHRNDRLLEASLSSGARGSYLDERHLQADGGDTAEDDESLRRFCDLERRLGGEERRGEEADDVGLDDTPRPPLFGHSPEALNRSSLGILPIDRMQDLSSSVLHFTPTPSPTKAPSSQQPARGPPGDDDDTLEQSGEDIGPASKHPSSLKRPTTQAENTDFDVCGGRDYSAAPLRPPPRSVDVCGGRDNTNTGDPDFTAAMDLDTSVHEVRIDAAELQMFDDTFSDLDSTLRSDAGDVSMPDGGRGFPVQQNLFSVPHELRLSDMDIVQADAESYDEVDDDAETDRRSAPRGQEEEEDERVRKPNQGEGEEQTTTTQQQTQVRRPAPTTTTASLSPLGRASGGGLDSMYFRQSPQLAGHSEGDGEEEGEEPYRPYRGREHQEIFDDYGGGERVRGSGIDSDAESGGGRYDSEDDEMDTSDELEAVRREMRATLRLSQQRAPGAGYRPVEGGGRPVAEGDADDAPTPGDGDGRNSDDDAAVTAVTTAGDLLSVLGFHRNAPRGGATASRQVEPRVAPQGEDLSTRGRAAADTPRTVRFAASAHVRARTPSETRYNVTHDSDEEEDSRQLSHDAGGEVSRLDDHFLTPAAHKPSLGDSSTLLGTSAFTTAGAGGLGEDSTFNLTDIYRRPHLNDTDGASGFMSGVEPLEATPTQDNQAFFGDNQNIANATPTGHLHSHPGNTTHSQASSTTFSQAGSMKFSQAANTTFSKSNNATFNKSNNMTFSQTGNMSEAVNPFDSGLLPPAGDDPFGLGDGNYSRDPDNPFDTSGGLEVSSLGMPSGDYDGDDDDDDSDYLPRPDSNPKPAAQKADDSYLHSQNSSAQSGPGKTFLSEDSPVYINEEGEVVTDLAYKVELEQVVADPFDLSSQQQADFGDEFEADAEFVSGAAGLALLDKDEEEFQKENIFIQEDQMGLHQTSAGSGLGNTTASTLGLPDSWSLHSHLTMPPPGSWTDDDTAAYMRISIGEFMAARTETLGHLDGDAREPAEHRHERPHFGSAIHTPPDNRKKLKPLLSPPDPPQPPPSSSWQQPDTVAADTGDDLSAADVFDGDDETGATADGVRGLGVGSDGGCRGHPRSQQRAASRDTAGRDEMFAAPAAEDSGRCLTPADLSDLNMDLSSDRAPPRATSVTPPTTSVTPGNETTRLDMSEIQRLIDGVSPGVRPDQLVSIIADMTQSKSALRQQQRGSSVSSSMATTHDPAPAPRRSVSRGAGEASSTSESTVVPVATTAPQPPAAATAAHRPSSTRGSEQKRLSDKENIPVKSQRDAPTFDGTKTMKIPKSEEPFDGTKKIRKTDDRAMIHPPKPDSFDGTKTVKISRSSGESEIPSKRSSSYTKIPKRQSSTGTKTADTNAVRNNKKTAEKKDKQTTYTYNSLKNSTLTRNKGSVVPKVLKDKDIHAEFSDSSHIKLSNVSQSSGEKDKSPFDSEWKSPRPSDVYQQAGGRGKAKSRRLLAPNMDISSSNNNNAALFNNEALDDEALTPSPPARRTQSVVGERRDPVTVTTDSQHHTPTDLIATSAEKRHSTPLSGQVLNNLTLGASTNSVSKIMTPHDLDLTRSQAQQNLTPDDLIGNEKYHNNIQTTQRQHGASHQSTPKLHKPPGGRTLEHDINAAAAAYSTHTSAEVLPYGTLTSGSEVVAVGGGAVRPGPGGSKPPPTLLTSQSLTNTAFATQYLNPSPTTQAFTRLSPLANSSTASLLWGAATSPPMYDAHHLTMAPLPPMADSFLLSQHQMSPRGAAATVPYSTSTPMFPDGGQKTMTSQQQQGAVSGLLSAPPVLRLPVCCVGLSSFALLPLTNRSPRWLHVSITTVSVSRQPHDNAPSPFLVKEKVMVEPHTTEEVKVIFAGRSPGVYVGVLRVEASPVVSDQPLRPDSLPAMVTLQAVAETPRIQVVSPGGDLVVDYGSLPWGCHKALPITLINHSRVNVPVRLVITAQCASAWNCFAFERRGSSSLSLGSSPGSLDPSVANLSLPATTDDAVTRPVDIDIYFRAPPMPRNAGDRASVASLPPTELTARLALEVDTPGSLPAGGGVSLGTVTLRAAVGTARLHAPSDMELLEFKAEPNQSQTKVIPLRNAGNIDLEVSLDVTSHADVFMVIPAQLMIEPGGQSEVVLKFSPTPSSPHNIHSTLSMFVEPDGPGYEIDLSCEVTTPRPRPGPGTLLADKHTLVFGGVALGHTRHQTVSLKNVSAAFTKLHMEIVRPRGETQTRSDFQFQSTYGGKTSKLAASKEIVVKPGETSAVTVVFSPSRVTGSEAVLRIRQLETAVKYTIPLQGYGGVSRLRFDNIKEGANRTHWVNVGEVIAGGNASATVTVTNSGDRTAFCVSRAFTDLSLSAPSPSLRVTPAAFLLPPGGRQTLLLALGAGDSAAAACRDKPAVVGAVAFLHGDEAQRQKLKRWVKQSSGGPVPAGVSVDQLTRSADLGVLSLEGEAAAGEAIEAGSLPGDSPRDADVFYAHAVTRTTLALVGEPMKMPPPPPPLTVTMATLASDSAERWDDARKGMVTPPVRPGSATGLTPPIRDSHSKTAPARSEEGGPWWGIMPETVVLTAAADTEDSPPVTRVLLINYSSRVLGFELSWPAHRVTVTPERGEVAPGATATVCVSARDNNTAGAPWSGHVYITCDGQQKMVPVQIRPARALPEPLPPAGGASLLSVTTETGAGAQPRLADTQTVEFPRTPVGGATEVCVDLTNTSHVPVKWTVSSFAPPYIKTCDSVQRVGYSAFWLPCLAGVLSPQQSQRVAASFRPREAGAYSQFWEVIQAPAAGTGQSASTKLELTAEAYHEGVSRPDSETEAVTATTGQLQKPAGKARNPSNIFDMIPSSGRLEFPVTEVKQTSLVKLELKNVDVRPHALTVAPLNPPFHVKHRNINIKDRHYVRLPVEFRPRKAGHFQGTLVLHTDVNTTLTAQLLADSH